MVVGPDWAHKKHAQTRWENDFGYLSVYALLGLTKADYGVIFYCTLWGIDLQITTTLGEQKSW